MSASAKKWAVAIAVLRADVWRSVVLEEEVKGEEKLRRAADS